MIENSAYEYRAATPIRRRSGFPTAVVLFHEGRCHFATRGSAPERELLDAGALHVGVLRFDRPGAASAAGQVALTRVAPEAFAGAWGSGAI